MTPTLPVRERRAQQTMKRALLILLLLLAAAEFFIRGPLRYFRSGFGWSDITQVYVPSRAWIEGANPYSVDNFIALHREATNQVVDRTGFRSHSPHPLTTLVVFSPVASLPWPLAHKLWAIFTGTIILPAIFCLGSFLGPRAFDRKLGFAALTLALAPLHTGIAAGNVSVPAIALCAIAFWAVARKEHNLAGVLIAIAACLKPQIGGLFVLYYLARRQWRVALVAIGVSLAVFLVGIGRLEWSGSPWWNDFLANAQAAKQDRLMDFADPGPLRYTMINLQVLLYTLLPNPVIASAGALLIGVALWGGWARFGLRSPAFASDLLMASAFLIIGLLPIYHRNYDATLLIFPLCWALSPEAARYGRARWLALLVMVPFLLPGPTLLQSLTRRGFLYPSITSGWWWDAFLMPHQTWLLCILCVLLLRALATRPDPAVRAI